MVQSQNTKNILVIHGPNLNMLGTREPEVYGTTTLADVNKTLVEEGQKLGLSVATFQSNHEGEIVDKIQGVVPTCQGLIINPAAFTHTSIAIRDAVLLLSVPVVEIHLSNIYRREAFRHKSMLADIATGQIAGFGINGYRLAIRAMADLVGAGEGR